MGPVRQKELATHHHDDLHMGKACSSLLPNLLAFLPTGKADWAFLDASLLKTPETFAAERQLRVYTLTYDEGEYCLNYYQLQLSAEG